MYSLQAKMRGFEEIQSVIRHIIQNEMLDLNQVSNGLLLSMVRLETQHLFK